MDSDYIRRGKGDVLRRVELADDRFVVRATFEALHQAHYRFAVLDLDDHIIALRGRAARVDKKNCPCSKRGGMQGPSRTAT